VSKDSAHIPTMKMETTQSPGNFDDFPSKRATSHPRSGTVFRNFIVVLPLFWEGPNLFRGTRYRSWLRHYAKSRKVPDTIPDGVFEFFQFIQSFQPHYGSGVDSASNRNEYQESFWDKGRPARKAENFTVVCEPIV
jgi:hypothetical protein